LEEGKMTYQENMDEAADRIEALEAEGAKLSAGICEFRGGNEHGNPMCLATGKLIEHMKLDSLSTPAAGDMVIVPREAVEKVCKRLEFDASWDKCEGGYYTLKSALGAAAPPVQSVDEAALPSDLEPHVTCPCCRFQGIDWQCPECGIAGVSEKSLLQKFKPTDPTPAKPTEPEPLGRPIINDHFFEGGAANAYCTKCGRAYYSHAY
jgi:hypothetical protein